MKCDDGLLDFARKIFNQWEGEIITDKESIMITHRNDLGGKKIICEVKVGYQKSEKYPYFVDACEKTYSILGGCGSPCVDLKEVEKDVLRNLKRFKFKEKEQLSLFDF